MIKLHFKSKHGKLTHGNHYDYVRDKKNTAYCEIGRDLFTYIVVVQHNNEIHSGSCLTFKGAIHRAYQLLKKCKDSSTASVELANQFSEKFHKDELENERITRFIKEMENK